jgi:hypothetical protein
MMRKESLRELLNEVDDVFIQKSDISICSCRAGREWWPGVVISH